MKNFLKQLPYYILWVPYAWIVCRVADLLNESSGIRYYVFPRLPIRIKLFTFFIEIPGMLRIIGTDYLAALNRTSEKGRKVDISLIYQTAIYITKSHEKRNVTTKGTAVPLQGRSVHPGRKAGEVSRIRN